MEEKNFSVYDLEKHQTKDVTDSHINGELTALVSQGQFREKNFRILNKLNSKLFKLYYYCLTKNQPLFFYIL